MLRLLLPALFLLAAGLLRADALDDKVKMLVDDRNYIVHQKLLDVLFRDRGAFMDGEKPDVMKVTRTLKENGLLNIFYADPRPIEMTVATPLNPPLVMKTVLEVLNRLGYTYFLTVEVLREENRFSWTIRYSSRHAVDPAAFAGELEGDGIAVEDLSKEGDRWIYRLTGERPFLQDAYPVASGAKEENLVQPGGEYWLALDRDAGRLTVRTGRSTPWYPYLAAYDRELNLLEVIRQNDNHRNLFYTVPSKTAYVKITDSFAADNLKHGIRVKVRKRR